MKQLLLIILHLIFVLANTTFACQQEAEFLKFESNYFTFESGKPIEDYLRVHPEFEFEFNNIKSKVRNKEDRRLSSRSSCHRGYHAYYEIIKNGLYINRIFNGSINLDLEVVADTLNLQYNSSGIPAYWYSGVLLMSKTSNQYRPNFKLDNSIAFIVENGQLVETVYSPTDEIYKYAIQKYSIQNYAKKAEVLSFMQYVCGIFIVICFAIFLYFYSKKTANKSLQRNFFGCAKKVR